MFGDINRSNCHLVAFVSLPRGIKLASSYVGLLTVDLGVGLWVAEQNRIRRYPDPRSVDFELLQQPDMA